MNNVVTVELFDVNTQEKQVVEGKNFITKALATQVEQICKNIMGLFGNLKSDILMGGTLCEAFVLTDNTQALSPDDTIMKGRPIGYCNKTAYTGTNVLRGTINLAETKLNLDGSYTIVMDFPTHACIGTFRTVGYVTDVSEFTLNNVTYAKVISAYKSYRSPAIIPGTGSEKLAGFQSPFAVTYDPVDHCAFHAYAGHLYKINLATMVAEDLYLTHGIPICRQFGNDGYTPTGFAFTRGDRIYFAHTPGGNNAYGVFFIWVNIRDWTYGYGPTNFDGSSTAMIAYNAADETILRSCYTNYLYKYTITNWDTLAAVQASYSFTNAQYAQMYAQIKEDWDYFDTLNPGVYGLPQAIIHSGWMTFFPPAPSNFAFEVNLADFYAGTITARRFPEKWISPTNPRSSFIDKNGKHWTYGTGYQFTQGTTASGTAGWYVQEFGYNMLSAVLLPAPITKTNTQTMKIIYTINFS